MQNSALKKLSPAAKLISLLSIIISILIAKSIYLMLLLTTFLIFICILTSEKVNIYVKFIKKILFLLLFITFIYILVLSRGNILSILVFIIKELLICIYIKVFELNINFFELHEAFYKLLLPFKKIDIATYSYDIAMSLYLINKWFESKEVIKERQIFYGKINYNFKNKFLPRIVYTFNQINILNLKLKISNYKVHSEKSSFKSKITIVLFILFLILCIYKEVFL